MRDPYEYPKLRWPIEVERQTHDGQEILVLRCPLGIADQPLGLSAATAPVLQEFEGKLSIAEIDAKLKKLGSTPEILRELVILLDRSLFLDSPHYIEVGEKVRATFAAAPERDPYLAGLSYPADAQELSMRLDEFLQNRVQLPKIREPMIGLVSPHIDYRRGGVCYGIAWNQLRDQQHDLYLVVGTAHQYSELMFHLTRKHFNTPLGQLHCDVEFVDQLASRYGAVRSFTDEYLHRREHSLELQTPFLQRLTNNPKIVPILVGSFYSMLRSGNAPEDVEAYESFAGALAELVRAERAAGKKVCVIAGVDMAHVGQQFGDKAELTPEFMSEVGARDRQYLQAILEQDKKKLWTHIEEDMDRRRMCGFPTMYTVIDLFDRIGVRYSADLFDYRQAVDYQTQCAVTFAGLGIYA